MLREDACERGQQGLVHGTGGAVGVGGEPGSLGQHVEAGEEAGAAVHAPDVVGTVAADVGKLEGEEAEHGLQRGEGVGAGIAGAFDGFVNAVAAQQGQEAEQSGGAADWNSSDCWGSSGRHSGACRGAGPAAARADWVRRGRRAKPSLSRMAAMARSLGGWWQEASSWALMSGTERLSLRKRRFRDAWRRPARA